MDGQGADAAADIALARQLILAACASGNAGALSERLDGVSAALSAELQTEIGAARKTLGFRGRSQAARRRGARGGGGLREQLAAAADERRRGEAGGDVDAAADVRPGGGRRRRGARAGSAGGSRLGNAAEDADQQLESVVVALGRRRGQEKQRVQTELGVAQQRAAPAPPRVSPRRRRGRSASSGRSERRLRSAAGEAPRGVATRAPPQLAARLHELALPAAEGAAGEGTIEEATRASSGSAGGGSCAGRSCSAQGRAGPSERQRRAQALDARAQAGRPAAGTPARSRPRNSAAQFGAIPAAQFVGAIF